MTQQPDPVLDELELVNDGASLDPPEQGWWDRYSASLGSSSISETARSVIESDSRYVLAQGVLGAGEAGDPRWPNSRTRCGLVMGAVQSGKTASMLGVGALALDAGIDILVVLAGTRVALWRQTYDRLIQQLDGSDIDSEFERASVRVLAPPLRLILADDAPASNPRERYQIPSSRARRALRAGSPLILIVMKHGQHLRAAAQTLHERVYPNLERLRRPAHVLVLDDEADDGSILDAVVEGQLDPAHDSLKQIPRHIVDLWSLRGQVDGTAAPNLHATYIGYTATPQPNLLQADQNPLAPRDFIVALRTPFDVGELEPRATTFREPSGIAKYYTGGEVFYGRLGADAPLVMPYGAHTVDEGEPEADAPEKEDTRRRSIAESVRAYLMAGAIRLWRDPDRQPLAGLQEKRFASLDDAKSACPSPHSMLFHPSSAVSDQFIAAAEILEWTDELDPDTARHAIATGRRSIHAVTLRREVSDDDSQWVEWMARYRGSAVAVQREFGLPGLLAMPQDDDWDAVRHLLLEEVLPNVQIAIINSDPEADDRPEFEPQPIGSSGWRAPRNIFTIFVSGNVMARGLTLEGLTTTLFLRSSGDPAADTQMQMQRWFGYRGAYLDLCRVFAPESQLQLFRQYHATDEALRQQLIQAMNTSGEVAPRPTVIEGHRFKATGKIAGVTKVPLCPGATPFVDIVNDGHELDPNVALVADVFSSSSSPLEANGTLRGQVLNDSLSLEDTASLLSGLQYDAYAPAPNDPMVQRWSALEAQLRLGDDGAAPLRPFFTVPAVKPHEGEHRSVLPTRCPYSIAAYLRLWNACLTRHARGLFPTEDGETPWSLLDLRKRKAMQPRFWVGIRFGSGKLGSSPSIRDPLADLPFAVSPMRRAIEGGVVTSTWGSRNPGETETAYLGDQLFDYHYHGGTAPPVLEGGPMWRPVGAPGLILFHVIKADDRAHPVVAVGVAIPLGGPDHFAAHSRG